MRRNEVIEAGLFAAADDPAHRVQTFLSHIETLGFTVVPDNDWAFMARFSKLPNKSKEALIAFLDGREG